MSHEQKLAETAKRSHLYARDKLELSDMGLLKKSDVVSAGEGWGGDMVTLQLPSSILLIKSEFIS